MCPGLTRAVLPRPLLRKPGPAGPCVTDCVYSYQVVMQTGFHSSVTVQSQQ